MEPTTSRRTGMAPWVAAAHGPFDDLLEALVLGGGGPEPDWARAACRGHDVHLWFPRRGGDTRWASRRARDICAGCPVAAPCREWSLSASDRLEGLWGGLSQAERRQERRRRRAAGSLG